MNNGMPLTIVNQSYLVGNVQKNLQKEVTASILMRFVYVQLQQPRRGAIGGEFKSAKLS